MTIVKIDLDKISTSGTDSIGDDVIELFQTREGWDASLYSKKSYEHEIKAFPNNPAGLVRRTVGSIERAASEPHMFPCLAIRGALVRRNNGPDEYPYVFIYGIESESGPAKALRTKVMQYIDSFEGLHTADTITALDVKAAVTQSVVTLIAELGITEECARDILYLRTRNRHSEELEQQLIQLHRDGTPPNMMEFGVTAETQQNLLDQALAVTEAEEDGGNPVTDLPKDLLDLEKPNAHPILKAVVLEVIISRNDTKVTFVVTEDSSILPMNAVAYARFLTMDVLDIVIQYGYGGKKEVLHKFDQTDWKFTDPSNAVIDLISAHMVELQAEYKSGLVRMHALTGVLAADMVSAENAGAIQYLLSQYQQLNVSVTDASVIAKEYVDARSS